MSRQVSRGAAGESQVDELTLDGGGRDVDNKGDVCVEEGGI